MKKRTIIISLTALIIVSGVFLSFTYLNADTELKDDPTVKKADNEEKHSCCSSEDAEEFSESSIYQLESEWLTQDGNKFELEELTGKPVVLTMFFASCTYACPILVNDMKKIEASLSEKELQKYQFVLVSIDPERDTPEALKKFAAAKELDLKRWTLLTGSSDDVLELAALTGFKYKKEPDGSYSHSNMIMILNEQGEIAHQHLGLNQDLTAALTLIKNL